MSRSSLPLDYRSSCLSSEPPASSFPSLPCLFMSTLPEGEEHQNEWQERNALIIRHDDSNDNYTPDSWRSSYSHCDDYAQGLLLAVGGHVLLSPRQGSSMDMRGVIGWRLSNQQLATLVSAIRLHVRYCDSFGTKHTRKSESNFTSSFRSIQYSSKRRHGSQQSAHSSVLFTIEAGVRASNRPLQCTGIVFSPELIM